MDKRVQFDFAIEFTNGGGIQGQDFRLDIAGETISDQELADYIVQDMRLLMVDRVQILNKQIIEEKDRKRPMPRERRSRLAKSRWSPTPVPMSIVCSIAMPRGKIYQR